MIKYHKEIGFKENDVILAKALILVLNRQKIIFSRHSLGELIQEKNCVEIGQFLKDYVFNFNDIFEIVVNNGIIEKIGFRVNFNEKDVIFMLSNNKTVITCWTCYKIDKHYTLNKNNYAFIS